MPSAVIDRVNVLAHVKRSMLVFTDQHGRAIGNYTPTVRLMKLVRRMNLS